LINVKRNETRHRITHMEARERSENFSKKSWGALPSPILKITPDMGSLMHEQDLVL